MRFLENLVSDMIRESTGVNPRRLIRKLGGKNLLVMGAGAALAGGLASQLGKGPNDTSAPAVPPPPPGAPGAVPPPPPIPSGSGAPPPIPPAIPATPSTASPRPAVEQNAVASDEGAELPPSVAYAIVRGMVAAALADGDLAEQEKKLVLDRVAESGLGEERVRQIHRDLVLPPSPAELARLAPGVPGREAVYRMAAAVILADGELSALERGWLDRLATAFELGEARKATLESEIFE